MVDCRNCKKHDIVWTWDGEKDYCLHVCWEFEMVIKKTEVKNGDCDCYVDMDSDLS